MELDIEKEEELENPFDSVKQMIKTIGTIRSKLNNLIKFLQDHYIEEISQNCVSQ